MYTVLRLESFDGSRIGFFIILFSSKHAFHLDQFWWRCVPHFAMGIGYGVHMAISSSRKRGDGGRYYYLYPGPMKPRTENSSESEQQHVQWWSQLIVVAGAVQNAPGQGRDLLTLLLANALESER